MALMMASLYDALREGGTSDESSRKAAEEVANYDNRLGGMEGKINLIQWMLGVNVALTTAVLFKLLS